MKQPEHTLGEQLLDRTGRAVRLTGAGATYVHHARGALRDLATAERAVQDLAGLSRGSVRLALTPTFSAYLLGPPAAALYTAHPCITLDVREMPQDRVEAGLLADDHDLGIAFHGPHAAGIAVAPLFTETLGLVTAGHRPGPGARRAALRARADRSPTGSVRRGLRHLRTRRRLPRRPRRPAARRGRGQPGAGAQGDRPADHAGHRAPGRRHRRRPALAARPAGTRAPVPHGGAAAPGERVRERRGGPSPTSPARWSARADSPPARAPASPPAHDTAEGTTVLACPAGACLASGHDH
ncbi:LysR substrate-binding domain-containing protein [Streptomyces sp. NPDC058613]|uniref:LysR substrate-binding domain-containing protein n=1 Tax=unclassified Streptomyces TaxID=2593676 RepID=UPI00365CFD6F